MHRWHANTVCSTWLAVHVVLERRFDCVVHESWAAGLLSGFQHSRVSCGDNQGTSCMQCCITSGFFGLRYLSKCTSVYVTVIYCCECRPCCLSQKSSYTLQHEDRKIQVWSETRLSSSSHQSAPFPTHTLHTHSGKPIWDLRRKSCYLSSRNKVWSAYSWSDMFFTAVEEALIEEIRGDGATGVGMTTYGVFSQLNK